MLHGQCYCGAVAFEADVSPSTGSILCHCDTCAHLNSAMSNNIQSEFAKIKVTKGQPAVFIDEKADSGKPISRFFCGTCASALYAVPTAVPGAVFIKVGCLQERKEVPVVAEVYVESAQKGLTVRGERPKGVASFEGMMAKLVT